MPVCRRKICSLQKAAREMTVPEWIHIKSIQASTRLHSLPKQAQSTFMTEGRWALNEQLQVGRRPFEERGTRSTSNGKLPSLKIRKSTERK
jgi:hypothetical protein